MSSVEEGGTFTRSTEGISDSTLAKAGTARFKLEHFYKNIVSECAEREAR